MIWLRLVCSDLLYFLCSLLKGKRNGKLLAFDFSEIKLQTMGHDADGSISLRRQAAPIEEEPKQKMYVFFMLMVNKLL